MLNYNILYVLAASGPHFLESSPYWVLLIEEYSPILAAGIAVIVLSRTGFTKKLGEYRKDTLDLIRLRAETLEKELADSHVEIQELTRELRSRDRRIESLEEELDNVRRGTVRKPSPPTSRPRRRSEPEPPPPMRAPDVDDR